MEVGWSGKHSLPGVRQLERERKRHFLVATLPPPFLLLSPASPSPRSFHEYYDDIIKYYRLEHKDGQGRSTGWPTLDQYYKVGGERREGWVGWGHLFVCCCCLGGLLAVQASCLTCAAPWSSTCWYCLPALTRPMPSLATPPLPPPPPGHPR